MGQPKTITDITDAQNRTDLLNDFISNYSFGRKIVDNMNQESRRYIKPFIDDCIYIKEISYDILELKKRYLIESFNNPDDVVIYFANKYNETENYNYDMYRNWEIVKEKMIYFNVEVFLENNIPEYYKEDEGEKSHIYILSSFVSCNENILCVV